MEHKQNLTQALVNFQAQMGTAPMNGYNPHFKNKFSTLEDLIDSSRDILTRFGLAVIQYPDSDGQSNFLVTKLKHVSGEEETSRALLVLKDVNDIQKLGSAISYMKRYAYAAICGIATSEADDDGHTATNTTPSSFRSEQNDTPPPGASLPKSDSISPKQFGLLKGKIKESGRPEREMEICRKYGIPSLDKLPWKKMQEVLDSFIGQPAPQATLDPQFEEVMDLPF